MLHIISLGAGVQSSTMALMAAAGEINPMPSYAVFADTRGEPAEVYRWLDWLEPRLPFPVHRVTRGDLGKDACRVRTSAGGKRYTKHAVPAFIKDPSGKTGLLMRQCTTDHKIDLLYREYTKRRNGGPVTQWLGISRDEASRMKPARRSWVTNRWPLIEAGITRADCLRWMKEHGHPTPPRSACVFCPYHNDAEWLRLKIEQPQEFAKAAQFERDYQAAIGQVSGIRGTPYLHRSCVPLESIDFASKPTSMQGNLFENECEGMCGV